MNCRSFVSKENDISSKSDWHERPTERQNLSVFCYVAKSEDIIVQEPDKAELLRLMLGGLVALGMTIVTWLAITIRSVPILVLLILPLLQLLAISAVRKWIRGHYPPRFWVRDYSPNSTPFATSLSSVAEGHHRADQ